MIMTSAGNYLHVLIVWGNKGVDEDAYQKAQAVLGSKRESAVEHLTNLFVGKGEPRR